ncbi:MAG TPA: DUF998 domain-containing protein [Mycobacterium sp.]|nr:DUF998 domain-containing protein [Mycobacterium sp.]
MPLAWHWLSRPVDKRAQARKRCRLRAVTVTRTRTNLTYVSALWLFAALAFLVCEAAAAAAVPAPGYSYTINLISELGVPGRSPLSLVMNVGFLLQGLLFLAGAVLVTRVAETGRRQLFLVLVSIYVLGVVLVAIFHGDSALGGNYEGGALHWLGALFAMVGGNAAIIAGSFVVAGLVTMRWYRAASIALGVAGLLSLLMIGNPAAQVTPGIWERGAVYTILFWQIVTALLLFARSRSDTPSR